MTKINTVSLTATQLRQAADLADEIQLKQNQLTALLSGEPVTFKGNTKTVKATVKTKGGKRTLTPEQKASISAGLKAKWAARKAAKTTATEPTEPTPLVSVPSDNVIPAGAEAVRMVPPPNRA
jgi:hypothetical protein